MTFADCKNAKSCGKTLCLPEFCHQFDPILKTNADRIREMSDEELARFLADKLATESCKQLASAVAIEAIRHNWYCAWMQWLKQPVGEVSDALH